MARRPEGVYGALMKFRQEHEECGGVRVDTPDPPTSSGYELRASCTGCGAFMQRWVTPQLARLDLIFSALLCSPN